MSGLYRRALIRGCLKGMLAPPTLLRKSILVNTDLTPIFVHLFLIVHVRMTPGGPGCGLQIRRQCDVAEAQLLLSDVTKQSTNSP